MPALFWASLPHTLVDRNAAADVPPSSPASTATSEALQVVCAWPVSGQYGPGSRVLYYVLVAACVFARKTGWLRNACLAAALLFPAIAAVHGIVLAAVPVNGAVDMDVFGAFQLCSIGILAAPVTARLSGTYFYDPGRNTIFLWTGLILAGLLSLTVEFFRIETSDCTRDNFGEPIHFTTTEFPYGRNNTCGLICSVEQGPVSPLRGGSANNIYVIPAPDKLTFGTATLLAAACCIPAILSLISMWDKILEINWNTRFGDGVAGERSDEPIEGTNGATIGKMRGINNTIRFFRSVAEIPVFGGAVLAILILGERNFFSPQVRYQTEPISSIGQWAPIVGTGLAALGSLYLLLAADMEAVKEEANPNASMQHCNCSHHHHVGERPPSPPGIDAQSADGNGSQSPLPAPKGLPVMEEVNRGPSTMPFHAVATPGTVRLRPSFSDDLVPTSSRSAADQSQELKRSPSTDAGSRRRVAEMLTAIGNYLGTAAHDWSDDSDRKALDFPEIPGEKLRNSALHQIKELYNQLQNADGNATPVLRHHHSRAGSFTGSATPGVGVEGSSTMTRASLPQSSLLPQPPSPFLSPSSIQRPHASTSPAERISFELQNPVSSSPADTAGDRPQVRQDVLEARPPVHHSPTRNNPPTSSTTAIVAVPRGHSSPAIVTSSHPDTSSSARMPILEPAALSPSFEAPPPPPPLAASPPP